MLVSEFEFNPIEVKFIKQFNSRLESNELEIRFGRFNTDGVFTPGVEINKFKSLLKHLSLEEVSLGQVDILKIFYGRESLLVIGRQNIQLISSASTTSESKLTFLDWDLISSQTKIKAKPSDNRDYDFRISSAKEITSNIPEKDKRKILKIMTDELKTFRYMKRYSFKNKDGNWRFDLSIVKASFQSVRAVADSDVFTKVLPIYEIEIEYIGDVNKKNIDIDVLKSQITLVLKYLQDTEYPLSKSYRFQLFQDYTSSFPKHKRSDRFSSRASAFLGAMPVSLTLENVIPLDATQDKMLMNIRRKNPDDYTVTEKADGDRQLLFVSSSGNVFLISRQMTFTYTGLSGSKPGTLIDGEWLRESHRFLAFDMLFLEGRDIRMLPLMRSRQIESNQDHVFGRVDLLERLLSNPLSFSPRDAKKRSLNLAVKKHWAVPDIIKKAGDLWKNRMSLFKYNIDGIFFTPRAGQYPMTEKGSSTWRSCLKWKPRSLLSIDFQVFSRSDIKFHLQTDNAKNEYMMPYRVCHLHVQNPNQRFDKNVTQKPRFNKPDVILFSPLQNYRDPGKPAPHIARIATDDSHRMVAIDPITSQKNYFQHGDIVEFVYDSHAESGYEWKPIRIRSDKTVPNSARTAEQVWSVIHEANGLTTDDQFFELLQDKSTDQILRDQYHQTSKSYYAISESREERKDSPIFNLRQFHNSIKRKLYIASAAMINADQYKSTGVSSNDSELPISESTTAITALLDLGCGRGGDYRKYQDANIQRVYGVDVDKSGLDRLVSEFHEKLRRANKNPRVVITFQADMSKLLSTGSAALTQHDRKNLLDFFKRNGSGFFPLISCQFAMHYSFCDEISLRGFMMNIYENLQHNGYFIATTFDGQSVFDVLRDSSEKSYHNQNIDFGTIRKQFNQRLLASFGQPIDVKFQSISSEFRTEYLVNFSYFAQVMAEDYGIEVVSDEEAQAFGFSSGSASFASLFGESSVMSVAEQSWSRLCRYIIMKKVGNGNAAVQQKWLKKLTAKIKN